MDTCYAVSSIGINMHEIIMGQKSQAGFVIDHINRNSLDNRRSNLRFATFAQNAQNKDKSSECSSKYFGIHFNSNARKWKSVINLLGKQCVLGYFDVEEWAAQVYDAHALTFYGIHAKTNDTFNEFEIEVILTYGIPEDWMMKNGRRKIKLPTILSRNPDGSLVFEEGVFETMAEYFTAKDMAREYRRQNLEITRNQDGIAVFIINSHGLRYETLVDDSIWRQLAHCTFALNGNYVNISTKSKIKLLHQVVADICYGKIEAGYTVDHINRNSLDNRIANLRFATKSLQSHNRKPTAHKSFEKYKGVNYMKGKFHAFVNHMSHGTYDTEEEAAEHANRLYRELHGPNAQLNVIDYSKKTTKHNRIPDEMITLEFVMGLEYIKDLRDVIMRKKLNAKSGGPLKTTDMVTKHFEWLKMQTAKLLFGVEFIGLADNPMLNEDFSQTPNIF